MNASSILPTLVLSWNGRVASRGDVLVANLERRPPYINRPAGARNGGRGLRQRTPWPAPETTGRSAPIFRVGGFTLRWSTLA
jgi:hypothetical protein